MLAEMICGQGMIVMITALSGGLCMKNFVWLFQRCGLGSNSDNVFLVLL